MAVQFIDIEKLAESIAREIGKNYIAVADGNSAHIKDKNMIKPGNKTYGRILSIFNLNNKTLYVDSPNKEYEIAVDDALRKIELFYDHTEGTYREDLYRIYQIPELIFTPMEYQALLKTSELFNKGILKS